jgi:hypothetical protein
MGDIECRLYRAAIRIEATTKQLLVEGLQTINQNQLKPLSPPLTMLFRLSFAKQ